MPSFVLPEAFDWEIQAACREMDPEIWFPDHANGKAEKPRRICYRCPVRRECLEEALKNPETHGIWGGLDQRERRKVLRLRATAALRASACAVTG
jgi:WhiB family transcriptional regulator, redox-sensing transcriptional regulator